MTINPLVPLNNYKLPLDESICKINISGYSLDHYKTLNPEGYTILCHVAEASDGLTFFPKTSTIVLDNNQQSQLRYNFEKLFEKLTPSIAEEFGISKQAAVEKSVQFFLNNEITVRPTGIQGTVYKMMNSAQNFVPMSYTSEAVSVLKSTGLTGCKILAEAPLTFIGATYIGAMFFSYCGSIAGNNLVRLVFNSTSFVLSRPMWGVELILNGLIFRLVSHFIGLPMILNGTQEMLADKGLSLKESAKIGIAFERITNSTLAKKLKKIHDVIRDKGN